MTRSPCRVGHDCFLLVVRGFDAPITSVMRSRGYALMTLAHLGAANPPCRGATERIGMAVTPAAAQLERARHCGIEWKPAQTQGRWG